MKSNSAIDRLKSMYFLKSGLFQVKKLLKHLGNPQDSLQVIHVAGTNGKGSVCQMVSQVLQKQEGKKVGLFTSPHLIRANERIRLNGVEIKDHDFEIFLQQVFDAQEAYGINLSYFEAVFVCSILYFVHHQVDIAVIEVGLGGTLDATNVFRKPLATAITSIGFDHTHILGATRAQIQWNKMGIMKSGSPCFTRVDNPLMHHAAGIKKADLYIVSTNQKTNLPGRHQEENAGLAYDLLRYLGVSKKMTLLGLQDITHRGRCQWLAPNLLIDGAHNEHGLLALKTYVDSVAGNYDRLEIVYGCVKKKEEFETYISQHLITGDEHRWININSPRALRHKDIKSSFPFPMKKLTTTKSFFDKIYKKDEKRTLYLVYGSLYLMGEVLEIFT